MWSGKILGANYRIDYDCIEYSDSGPDSEFGIKTETNRFMNG